MKYLVYWLWNQNIKGCFLKIEIDKTTEEKRGFPKWIDHMTASEPLPLRPDPAHQPLPTPNHTQPSPLGKQAAPHQPGSAKSGWSPEDSVPPQPCMGMKA